MAIIILIYEYRVSAVQFGGNVILYVKGYIILICLLDMFPRTGEWSKKGLICFHKP